MFSQFSCGTCLHQMAKITALANQKKKSEIVLTPRLSFVIQITTPTSIITFGQSQLRKGRKASRLTNEKCAQ